MKTFVFTLFFALLLGTMGCGETTDAPASNTTATTENGLSEAQLRDGIGPIQQVSLDAIDAELVAQGQETFTMKCSACHKMDTRYVGPPLGNVLNERSPAFVMNMMLNPAEMVEKHPEVRAMLAQYMTPMPNQSLTEADARAILEYLRSVQPTVQPTAQPGQ